MATAQEEDLRLLIEVMLNELFWILVICNHARSEEYYEIEKLRKGALEDVPFEDLAAWFVRHERAIEEAEHRTGNLLMFATERLIELASRTSETRGVSRDS